MGQGGLKSRRPQEGVQMYRIGKKWTFDAAHRLPNLPEGHKCKNLHGHTYTVELSLKGPHLTIEGWVVDYGDLKPFKDYIDRELDHKYLNDVFPSDQTTAEVLATKLYWKAYELFAHLLPPNTIIEYVRVSETPNTFAEYSQEG